MVETITTERLVLRPLRASDAGPISLHASDERVARMTAAIPHPYPPGAADAYIEGTLAGRRAEEVWAIDATPLGGEELIGVIGYIPKPGGLGYWVGPPYWNVGYATEAVAALVAHLFTVRGIERLDATVFTDNAASASVLKKAGFRDIGSTSIFSVARGTAVQSRTFRLERAGWAGALEPGPVAR
ncbi:MAG: GNAT family N-acetyltransferase [Alphaproteobacteria bacterium]|nr:GNAT family N-acetyltransferase [Alphaproteobacteria bacterium]